MPVVIPKLKALIFVSLFLVLAALVACGTAEESTSGSQTDSGAAAPAAPAAAPASSSDSDTGSAAAPAPAASSGSGSSSSGSAPAPAAAQPTPVAMAEPAGEMSDTPKTAKDRAVAVIATEPEVLFFMLTADAHTGQFTDTINAYVGHLDKNTLEVAPTSLVESWKQTAPDQWEYKLRPGVTFHDGEAWNAEAWQVYARITGVQEFGQGAFAHTGPYSVEPIDELTAQINCGENCPLFPRGLNLSKTNSPAPLRDVQTVDQLNSITDGIGAGPFQVVTWNRGQNIVTEKFEDFVPAPETPEYAAPILNEIEWQWRQEPGVRNAMIQAEEADWAFLLTLSDAEELGPERFVTGGTAEIAQFRIDAIWDPWLKIKEMRQAVVHSIDCPAIVDNLYQGATTCRGNHGAPGVLGITEENIRPYEYNPEKSRMLLEEIGYICGLSNSRDDCEAEITITSRNARIAKNDELIESMVLFMREAGINAKAQFVEVSIRTQMGRCGLGIEGAGGTQVGWQGATEAVPPTCSGGVGVGQILDGIGFGYEIMDYAKLINRHLLCESGRSTVCVPEMEEQLRTARTLDGEDRRIALEAIADWQRENVYILPMFDLFAIYGINPKLRGFEEPRFDKHTFANLWWFEE